MELDTDDSRAPYLPGRWPAAGNHSHRAIRAGRPAPVRAQNLPSTGRGADDCATRPSRPSSIEGLVVSRQGSGVFVRERTRRSVELEPQIEQAFESDQVSLDFAGFSAETLHGVLAEPLDKIRAGRLAPGRSHCGCYYFGATGPMVLPARPRPSPTTRACGNVGMASSCARSEP